MTAAVHEVLRSMNCDTHPDTRLLGGVLDSLGIVQLLVELEKHTGVALLGKPEVIREGGPLETVGSLIAHLEAK